MSKVLQNRKIIMGSKRLKVDCFATAAVIQDSFITRAFTQTMSSSLYIFISHRPLTRDK